MRQHRTEVRARHYVGVVAKGHYRAHCTCGWRSRGDLTKAQAERAELKHRESAMGTTSDIDSIARGRIL